MKKDREYWVKKLDLQPHPEGGYFRETYRSEETIAKTGLPDRYNGARAFSTAIYFLLENGNFSAFHRLKSDELWHFCTGETVIIHIIDPRGNYETIQVGDTENAAFQTVVKAGCWFAAEVTAGGFSLVSCMLAPGFDFADFELAERKKLVSQYPQHQDLITRLTR